METGTFTLQITSKDSAVYAGACSSIVVPLPDGLYGILRNHAPLVAALSAGEIRFAADFGERSIPITRGLLHFSNNFCEILIE